MKSLAKEVIESEIGLEPCILKKFSVFPKYKLQRLESEEESESKILTPMALTSHLKIEKKSKPNFQHLNINDHINSEIVRSTSVLSFSDTKISKRNNKSVDIKS